MYWWELWYKLKCFFKPRQEWLTDVIPDTYCDTTYLIPKLLFKCLVHYVEVDRKKDHVFDFGCYDWSKEAEEGRISQEYANSKIREEEELLNAYNWITVESKELEKKIDEAYPETNIDNMFTKRSDGDYDLNISDEERKCYDEVNRLTEIKESGDMACLKTIIKYHQTFWV